MDLTESYLDAIPEDIRAKYDFAEVRDAAKVIAASNPQELAEVLSVLERFTLSRDDIVNPGGQKSDIAGRLDETFRELGWREGRFDLTVRSEMRIMPYKKSGEQKPLVVESEVLSQGYKIDNLKGKVALDVEWHAKDGNLDRDVSAYRALYGEALIVGGIIITRAHASIRALAIRLGRAEGFKTTTTTNLEKLVPRLKRGDAGGCPVLAVAITDRCYDGS